MSSNPAEAVFLILTFQKIFKTYFWSNIKKFYTGKSILIITHMYFYPHLYRQMSLTPLEINVQGYYELGCNLNIVLPLFVAIAPPILPKSTP